MKLHNSTHIKDLSISMVEGVGDRTGVKVKYLKTFQLLGGFDRHKKSLYYKDSIQYFSGPEYSPYS